MPNFISNLNDMKPETITTLNLVQDLSCDFMTYFYKSIGGIRISLMNFDLGGSPLQEGRVLIFAKGRKAWLTAEIEEEMISSVDFFEKLIEHKVIKKIRQHEQTLN